MSVFTFGEDFEVPENPIPACGARRNILDMREQQQTLPRMYGRRTAWRPDYEKGELRVTCSSTIPSWAETKFEAAAFRRAAPLKRIIFLIDPDIYREQVNELAHLKFDRDMRYEDAHQREFALVRECKPITPKQS